MGFAVRTANANAVGIHARDCAEQFGTLKSWHAQRFCGTKLRVIIEQGGGVYDHFGVSNVFRTVPHGYRYAQRTEFGQVVAFIVIRSGERVTLLQENFCERAHPRSADADHMDPFNLFQ